MRTAATTTRRNSFVSKPIATWKARRRRIESSLPSSTLRPRFCVAVRGGRDDLLRPRLGVGTTKASSSSSFSSALFAVAGRRSDDGSNGNGDGSSRNSKLFFSSSSFSSASVTASSSSSSATTTTTAGDRDNSNDDDSDNGGGEGDDFATRAFAAASTATADDVGNTNSSSSDDYNDQDDWRNFPSLRYDGTFPTWKVPTSSVHELMQSKSAQPYLASRYPLLRNLQLRFSIVRNDIDDQDAQENDQDDDDQDGDDKTNSKDGVSTKKGYKLLLLHPEYDHDAMSLRTGDEDEDGAGKSSTSSDFSDKGEDKLVSLKDLLERTGAVPGPTVPVRFGYGDWTPSYALSRVLPPEVHPPPTSFETVGHVAHLNLKSHHEPYRAVIGQVLLECLPNIETVIAKKGDVAGPYRTYEFDVVAGRNDTDVDLVENGIRLRFDLARVYWCSRLGQERKRLLALFRDGDWIADAFCGVGSLPIQAAVARNCRVWANDWNPSAVEAFKANAKRNHAVIERIECGDAYDFLMDLGLQPQEEGGGGGHDNGRCGPLPDHVVLNYPLEAPRFLGALRWWPTPNDKKKKKGGSDGSPTSSPRVHVYTFARSPEEDDGESSAALSADDVAVDLIASELLAGPGAVGEGDSATKTSSKEYLNRNFGCDVQVHFVRDVAPGKVVFCVSFSATPKLLRYMQGDYGDQ